MLFPTLAVFEDLTLREGAEQMAVDELLLQRASIPILRHYAWKSPQATFGFTQSLSEVQKELPHTPLTRRWTGGGIVPHGRDWTFSLIVPRSAEFASLRPCTSYTLIHDCVARAMLLAGVPSRLAAAEESSRGLACFANPAEHDLLAQSGDKLCGGAQRRTREGILHQGSIQSVKVPDGFLTLVAEAMCPSWCRFENPPSEDEINQLADEKYATAEWLNRRA